MKDKDKDKETTVFDLVEGVTPVDPKALADFERTMTEEVIPEIVRVMDQRRLFAARVGSDASRFDSLG